MMPATVSSMKLHARCKFQTLIIFGVLAVLLITFIAAYNAKFIQIQSRFDPLAAPLMGSITPFRSASPHQPILDMWRNSFQNESMLETAPFGLVLPSIIRALHAWQNPPNCANASFLLFDYSAGLGFGAIVKHFVVMFHHAIRTRRILVIDHSTPFLWTRGCADASKSGRHECYFLPLSTTCTFPVVDKLIKDGSLPILTLDDDIHVDFRGNPAIPMASSEKPNVVHFRQPKINPLAFKKILHGSVNISDVDSLLTSINVPTTSMQHRLQHVDSARFVWLTCLTHYFLRLNAPTADKIQTRLQKLFGTSNPDPNQYIGVPIRGSDKCFGNKLGGPGEMKCWDLDKILDIAERIAFLQPRITHVIITSEDPSAISQDKVERALTQVSTYRKLRVVRNVEDVVPGNRKGLFKPSYAELLFSSLVTLHLQSMAAFHVYAPRSTYHSLIGIIASCTPGKQTHTAFPIGDRSDLANSEKSQFI